jgi:hypothetical protein
MSWCSSRKLYRNGEPLPVRLRGGIRSSAWECDAPLSMRRQVVRRGSESAEEYAAVPCGRDRYYPPLLDRHSVPRDHAGQKLSLQARVQEFAFLAAAGAVRAGGRPITA